MRMTNAALLATALDNAIAVAGSLIEENSSDFEPEDVATWAHAERVAKAYRDGNMASIRAEMRAEARAEEGKPKKEPSPYLTSSDVAQIMGCDIKTVHNYVDRSQIPAAVVFTTPGRHLRFRPAPLVSWMESKGYGVPADLRARAMVGA